MDTIIWLIPIALTIFVIIKQVWRTWREGLFMALVYLVWTAVSAVAGFFLTRLLLDPARVDLFGLGALIVEKIPQDFFVVMPRTEAFLKALPTALAAVIAFPIVFDLLRVSGNRFLRKLGKKNGWRERFLTFRGEKLLSAVVAVFTAVICLMTDMIILTGTLTFCGNMLYCAKTAAGDGVFDTMGDAVHRLEANPVVRLSNTLGARDLFYVLTSASREGEPFSVGEEMVEISEAFVGMLPVFEVMPREGKTPTAQQLRALPDTLASSPESLELMVGVVRAYRRELGNSDAVMIVSELIGTTPDRFEDFLSELDMDTARGDMTTVCHIAALLADRGLLVESGQMFDLSCLNDPDLRADVQQELLKNEEMASFFGVAP